MMRIPIYCLALILEKVKSQDYQNLLKHVSSRHQMEKCTRFQFINQFLGQKHLMDKFYIKRLVISHSILVLHRQPVAFLKSLTSMVKKASFYIEVIQLTNWLHIAIFWRCVSYYCMEIFQTKLS